MVVLQPEFIQLPRCPGYYWNTVDQCLYSCKVSGVLTKLKEQKAFCGFGQNIPAGYRISRGGHRCVITRADITAMIAKLDLTRPQLFPVKNG